MSGNEISKEKKYLWKFRFFPIWREKQEEVWLRAMSQQGWHFSAVFLFFYRFEKGEPCDYIYQFDFKGFDRERHQEAMVAFENDGWQYIDRMAGWFYFRIQARDGKDRELYSHIQGKIDKYKRLLHFLLVLFWPVLYSPLMILVLQKHMIRFASVLVWILLPIAFLYIATIYYTGIKIKRLKKAAANQGKNLVQ